MHFLFALFCNIFESFPSIYTKHLNLRIMADNKHLRTIGNICYSTFAVLAILTVVGIIWSFQGIKIALIIMAVIFGFVAVDSYTEDKRSTKIYALLTLLSIIGIYGVSEYKRYYEVKQELAAIAKAPTTFQCKEFMALYPDMFTEQIMNLYLKCAKWEGISSLDNLADNYPESPQGVMAAEMVKKSVDSLYTIAQAEDSVESWERYMDKVPYRHYRDARQKAEAAEQRKWSSDENGWQTAKKENTIEFYNKYLKLYPKGKYAYRAKKNIIDIRVNKALENNPGELPSMNQINYNDSGICNISITNDTIYKLTVLYSSKHYSYEFTISAGKTKTVSLRAGDYRVVASVNVPNVIDFAGSEKIRGGMASVRFYIKDPFMPDISIHDIVKYIP